MIIVLFQRSRAWQVFRYSKLHVTPVFTSFEWVDEKLNLQEIEKSEGVGGGGINNGHSRDERRNIRHKTQNKDKLNKSTTNKTKKMTHGPNIRVWTPGVNLRVRENVTVPDSDKTSTVLLIVNSGEVLVYDRGK